MIFKLSQDIFSYLQQHFETENKGLQDEIKNAKKAGSLYLIDLNEDFAIEIRDWAGERLQVIGFDENYKLTKDGTLLEELIDKLFI